MKTFTGGYLIGLNNWTGVSFLLLQFDWIGPNKKKPNWFIYFKKWNFVWEKSLRFVIRPRHLIVFRGMWGMCPFVGQDHANAPYITNTIASKWKSIRHELVWWMISIFNCAFTRAKIHSEIQEWLTTSKNALNNQEPQLCGPVLWNAGALIDSEQSNWNTSCY